MNKQNWISLFWLFVGLAMVAGAWRMTRPELPEPVNPQANVIATSAADRQHRLDFYNKTISPLIASEDARNREAMQRAKTELDKVFASYRAGVPAFSDYLTTLDFRTKLIWDKGVDWYYEADTAGKRVSDLFSGYVMSDKQLKADIEKITQGFLADLEANRDKMLGEATEQLKLRDFPVPPLTDALNHLSESFSTELKDLIQHRAGQSPIVTLLAFGGGTVATIATETLVTSLWTALASRITVVAAEGGFTLAFAGGGSVAGSEVPCLGNAIGFGIGLLVGGAADWWANDRFKKKVTDDVNGSLAKIQWQVWADPKDGLEKQFTELADASRQCHEEALRKHIVENSK